MSNSETPTELQRASLLEKFQFVLQNNRNSVVGNLGVALLGSVLEFNTGEWLLLAAWFSVFVMVLGARYLVGQNILRAFKKTKPNHAETTLQVRKFALFIYATGFMWALFPWLFYQSENPETLALFAIVIAGIVAGSVSSLAAIPMYIRGFLLLTVVPLAVLFFSFQQYYLAVFGLMFLFYALFTLKAASQFHNSLERAIHLNLQNIALIDQLTIAKQVEENNSRLKSDFMRTVSHELRTPLNAIVGFTDLMLLNCRKKEWLMYLENIREGGEKLTLLIDDILDFSKIEQNHIQLQAGNFSAQEALQHIVNSLQPSVHSKELLIEIDISDKVPSYLYFDVFRWKQVIAKLLSNAIKFSPQHARIEVNLQYDAEQQLLECQIKDYGIGIAPAQQQQIFEAFTQADGSSTRQFGGTGLGLSIAKRLVDLMGGDIAVQSAPNQGSRFSFWIKAPLSKPAD
ncbi:histidine kinase [uncultured Thiomicrorhabdus sp.]